jgi:bifunctional lysine-specific demethylase and histidyl-hydroxylase NO66
VIASIPEPVQARFGRQMDPLRRCVGDPSTFLSGTWGARAAVHPAAELRGFEDLLTLDDVDRILTTTSLRTPSFRLVKAGEQIPESAYTRSGRTGSKPVSGMADPARIAELFDDGATIVLQGLHRNWEPVGAFCRALELQLGHPCQVNAYITPPGTQGLALHSDPHDVFVLQAFGRKHWEVGAAPAEPERDPLEADVEPGDCIYMPTGTPHAATTGSVLSGHLTVGVHVARWRDVLADVWRSLEDEPTLDEALPVGWTEDPAGFADQLRARLQALGAALGEVDADGVTDVRIRRFLSTRAQLLRGVLVQGQALDSIGDDTELTRRPGSVCEVRRDGDRLTALLGDRRLDMPGWLEPAMRMVASSEELAVRDLSPVLADPHSRLVLARRLVREGLLLADTARPEG